MRFATAMLAVLACGAVAQTVPMTNDACTTAITISDGVNPSAPSGLSGAVFTNVGATNNAVGAFTASCASNTQIGADTWFQYTASASGSITFSTCTPVGFTAGSLSDTVIALYNASACPAGAASIGCNDESCSSRSSLTATLTAGQSYYLRVGGWNGVTGTFYLTVTAPPPPPVNDECAGAIEIFDGVNPGAPTGASGMFFNNAPSTPSAGYGDTLLAWPPTGTFFNNYDCPFGTDPQTKDLFFKYTATCESTVISTCTPPGFAAGTLGDTVLQVYADCMNTTAIACNDDTQANGCGTQSSVQFQTTIGQTYYVRTRNWQAASAGGTFYLTVRGGGVFAETSMPGCGTSFPTPPEMRGTPPIIGGQGLIHGAQFAGSSPYEVYGSLCGAAPIDLSAISAGCMGYLDLDSLFLLARGTTDATGRFTVAGALPTDPSLACVVLCFQPICFPVGATPDVIQLGMQMSMRFAH